MHEPGPPCKPAQPALLAECKQDAVGRQKTNRLAASLEIVKCTLAVKAFEGMGVLATLLERKLHASFHTAERLAMFRSSLPALQHRTAALVYSSDPQPEKTGRQQSAHT